MRTYLLALLLLQASNSGARENPDPQTQVRPTPAPPPRYSASSPAAEYQDSLRYRETGGGE